MAKPGADLELSTTRLCYKSYKRIAYKVSLKCVLKIRKKLRSYLVKCMQCIDTLTFDRRNMYEILPIWRKRYVIL